MLAGMAVAWGWMHVLYQLCDNDGANWHSLLESLCMTGGCLSDGRVHDKHNVIWRHCLHHFLHLLKQRRLLLVAPTCVYKDDFRAFITELYVWVCIHAC